jgi:hypothetical protein
MNIAGNTILFEGMTSVSALISATRNGKAKRKIEKVIFSKSKVKKAHGRYIFIKKASEELGFEYYAGELAKYSPFFEEHFH